jgi:hypothetical protein
MALEQRSLVDVQVPVGDADTEVAERIGRDVDAAGEKTVALHRRKGSIVADDLGDRIRRRHAAFSPAIVRDHSRDTPAHWARSRHDQRFTSAALLFAPIPVAVAG